MKSHSTYTQIDLGLMRGFRECLFQNHNIPSLDSRGLLLIEVTLDHKMGNLQSHLGGSQLKKNWTLISCDCI